jgi:Domain of Unknown Function (DUF1080)
MAQPRRLLTGDLAGWRMAGPGGFRRLPDGSIESYGGSGLFWYPDEVFEDFVLTVAWRITRLEDNSGVFLRCPPLADSTRPATSEATRCRSTTAGLTRKAAFWAARFI